MPAGLAVGFGWETPGRSPCKRCSGAASPQGLRTGQHVVSPSLPDDFANGSRAAAELGNRLGSAVPGENRHGFDRTVKPRGCHIQVTTAAERGAPGQQPPAGGPRQVPRAGVSLVAKRGIAMTPREARQVVRAAAEELPPSDKDMQVAACWWSPDGPLPRRRCRPDVPLHGRRWSGRAADTPDETELRPGSLTPAGAGNFPGRYS